MEKRLTEVEKAIVRIDAMLPSFATKADIGDTKAAISEAKSDIIKWVVGTAIGLGAAWITVMAFVLNNAVPKASPTPPPAPIIFNAPAPQAPSVR